MRGAMPGLAMLPSATAGAQTLQLGEVGRWYLVLAPMHDAQACITDEDPLRPGLEAMLRDIHRRAMRDRESDDEKGLLAGCLSSRAEAAPPSADEEHCERVLAHLARGPGVSPQGARVSRCAAPG
jgi:hypothetical protein